LTLDRIQSGDVVFAVIGFEGFRQQWLDTRQNGMTVLHRFTGGGPALFLDPR